MRLSVGPSSAARGVTSFVAVVLVSIGFCFAALAFGMGGVFTSVGDSIGELPGDPSGGAGSVDQGFVVAGWISMAMGLCGVPFVLLGIYLAIHTWRFEIRLDGMTLSKRGALTTRRIDVTHAGVNMAGFNYTQRVGHDHRAVYRVAALAVTDPRTLKTIKVPLRGQGLDLLPPFQLRALADVLDRNLSADSQRARGIAAQLRMLASDPIAF